MNTDTLLKALLLEAVKLEKRHDQHQIGRAFQGLAETIKRLEENRGEREEKQHQEIMEDIDPLGQG